MRLTAETNPAGLKRYRHVRPARVPKDSLCAASCGDTRHSCDLAKGHSGPHVAHGLWRNVVAVWTTDAVAQDTASELRRPPRANSPVGLRAGRPTGVAEALWERVVRTISSLDELFFLVLFLAFVGFVIYWGLLIVG